MKKHFDESIHKSIQENHESNWNRFKLKIPQYVWEKGLPKSLEKLQINSCCHKSIPKSIQKPLKNLGKFKSIVLKLTI